jgi:hypothetical protein
MTTAPVAAAMAAMAAMAPVLLSCAHGAQPAPAASSRTPAAASPRAAATDPPPIAIAGKWSMSCESYREMVIELSLASATQASGRVVQPGAAAKYGFSAGEEILKLSAGIAGEWFGQVKWRGVSGLQHWDPIVLVGTADSLDKTLTNESCYRSMRRVP